MTGLTKMSMCCMSSAETGNKVDVITLSSFTQTKSEIACFFLNKIPLCFIHNTFSNIKHSKNVTDILKDILDF